MKNIEFLDNSTDKLAIKTIKNPNKENIDNLTKAMLEDAKKMSNYIEEKCNAQEK